MTQPTFPTLKTTITTGFSSLRFWERTELVLLILMAVVYPFSWSITVFLSMLLVVNAVARLCIYKARKCSFKCINKASFILFLILYALYLVSMTYTSNHAAGWETLYHKLPMLLFPIYFLVINMRWLQKPQLRMVGYAFAASCTVMAMVFIVNCLWQMAFHEAKYTILFVTSSLPHHTYSAMYFLLALAFLYVENKHYGREFPLWWNVVLWVSMLALVLITYFIQSRSGIIILIIFILCALYDILFRRGLARGWRIGVAVLVVGTAVGGLWLTAGQNRLHSTLKKVSSGSREDIRFEVWGNAWQVVREHPYWGVGVGDRTDMLDDNHERQFLYNPRIEWRSYNPHNQFLDAWLSVGIPGLLIMVAICVLPFIYALHCRPRNVLLIAFLIIMTVSCLVESILERQMGLYFICFCYGILQHPAITNSMEQESYIHENKRRKRAAAAPAQARLGYGGGRK